MFRFRVHKANSEVVLAACDESLLGRTLRHGTVPIEISESFYGDLTADENDLRAALGDCTIANLMGAGCINVALRMGLVSPERIIRIGEVPHAQVARMSRG